MLCPIRGFRHAEADRPDGPFSTSLGPPVVAPFAHNPAVSVAPDGTVVVFHIGSGDTPASRQGNCTAGVSGIGTNGTRAWCAAAASLGGASAPPRAGQAWASPNVAYSTAGPRGPWSLLGGGSSWGADNPAPIFLENGTVLLYAKFKCNATVNPRAAACYQYGTSLSGPISTILTVLSWICAGIYMCGARPSPVCA